MYGVEGT